LGMVISRQRQPCAASPAPGAPARQHAAADHARPVPRTEGGHANAVPVTAARFVRDEHVLGVVGVAGAGNAGRGRPLASRAGSACAQVVGRRRRRGDRAAARRMGGDRRVSRAAHVRQRRSDPRQTHVPEEASADRDAADDHRDGGGRARSRRRRSPRAAGGCATAGQFHGRGARQVPAPSTFRRAASATRSRCSAASETPGVRTSPSPACSRATRAGTAAGRAR
jgi:hypothetical protein